MAGGNMRVRLLLDLDNRLSSQAKLAQKDLRGVGVEANKLKTARGGDQLNASLKVTANQATLAQAAIAKARAEAKALANTNAKPRGLDQIKKDLSGFQNRRAPLGGGGSGGGQKSSPKAGQAAANEGGLSAGQGAGLGAAAAGARGLIMGAAPIIAPVAVVAKGIQTFKNLESAEKELAITTGETDAVVRKATEGFRDQSKALGTTATDMVKAAQLFAASGQDFGTSTASVTPTVRTAKAAFAEINDVATSGIAVMQNLKVPVTQLQEAYDRMAVSAKEGQVEMKDLARELPGALASYSKVGKGGLEGLSDVTAQMQIMRRSTSSAAEASNRLMNLYEKITSEETVKGFKDLGIGLQKELEAGAKKGESAIQTVVRLMDKVAKKKDGTYDAFKINSVFGDMQARAAIEALLKSQKDLAELKKKITETGKGTVDKDFARATDRIQADFDRLGASADRVMGRIGEAAKPAAAGIASAFATALDAVDEKLKKLNDTTRSGPLERLAAEADGEEAARKEFEGDTPKPKTPDTLPTAAQQKFNRLMDRTFGFGEAGNRERDLAESEGSAYRAEVEKRLTTMKVAAQKKLDAATAKRKELEEAPEPGRAAFRGPSQKRQQQIQQARDDETTAKDEVNRADQVRVDRTKRTDATVERLKQIAMEMRGNQSVMTMGRTVPQGQKFGTKPGVGTEAKANEVTGPGAGIGSLPGRLGFGLGGPVAKDILQSLQVEMKPAGGLIIHQVADGMKAAQGQTDGAAKQIGEGVKGQLSSVEAASAGQKVMSDYASGITSGGAAAVAAAQAVAGQVKAAMGGAGGFKTASIRDRLSNSLSDGVA